jgi:hypothetical protein
MLSGITLKRSINIRRNHDHALPAPELSPSFKGGHFPPDRRFASENGIHNLGGKWHNLFVYARTWAFLVDDWRKSMFIDKGTNYSLKMETVSLTLPDTAAGSFRNVGLAGANRACHRSPYRFAGPARRTRSAALCPAGFIQPGRRSSLAEPAAGLRPGPGNGRSKTG